MCADSPRREVKDEKLEALSDGQACNAEMTSEK